MLSFLKNKTDAMRCGRFVFFGASRLRVEPPVADWEYEE
jgi:hypothetical protein